MIVTGRLLKPGGLIFNLCTFVKVRNNFKTAYMISAIVFGALVPIILGLWYIFYYKPRKDHYKDN